MNVELHHRFMSYGEASPSQATGDWHYWLEQGNQLIDPDEYDEY